MKKGLLSLVMVFLVAIGGCTQIDKTGKAIGDIQAAAKIVMGPNEDPQIIDAAAEAAGALGITESAVVTDPDVSVTDNDLVIIGRYDSATQTFTNSFINEYISPSVFITGSEARIIAGSSPRTHVVILGTSVDLTVAAINIVKQYGLDGSYATELDWGVTRIDANGNIMPHCSDDIQNADETGIDCGGSECSACSVKISCSRGLPDGAEVNEQFAVTISVDLDDGGTETVFVEETIPAGCAFEGSSITPLDPSIPTWLFDTDDNPLPHNPRIDTDFSYNVICTQSGTKVFLGTFGTVSTGEITIPGDTQMEIAITVQCDDVDGDGYGVCPNCGIANGCTYDGDDCDDSNNAVNPGETEIACDGIDNDCSGSDNQGTDEDNDGAKLEGGLCGPVDCDDNDAKRWPGNKEVCDGKDNDCDASTDESTITEPCPLQNGVCAGSYTQCIDGSFRECGPDEYGIYYQVEETKCDALNNDCDDETDEGCNCIDGAKQVCAKQLGVCAGCQETCVNGQWPGCDDATYSACSTSYIGVELGGTHFDGIDNDCDGKTDEDSWVFWSYDTVGGRRSMANKIRSKELAVKGVVGDNAATADSIGVVDISGKLRVTDTVLASTIIDAGNEDLILVGGPCANAVTAQVMGIPHSDPECWQNFGVLYPGGQGVLEVYQNGDKMQLVAAGYTATDTRRVARAMTRYDETALTDSLKDRMSIKVVATGAGGINDLVIK